jgi:glycosyltransferase involved in cell wall biosynthesis
MSLESMILRKDAGAESSAAAVARPSTPSANVSVLILTLDEELNLPACLASVSWSDDIVVLDSFSQDRTVEIAREFGARVYLRRFDSEPSQRSFGLNEIAYKNRFVYLPDADEVTPPALRDEILAIAAAPGRPEVAFHVRSRTMFMGRWLRRSGLYPTWFVRLVEPGRVRFEREINLRTVADGPEGRLDSHLLHYTFNKGLNAWFEKHNRYSWHEARESRKSLAAERVDWGALLFTTGAERRRALKTLSFRLPCRPLLRFLYMYLLRGGFLDGRAGFIYCRLLMTYETMIVAKMIEIQRRDKGLPL